LDHVERADDTGEAHEEDGKDDGDLNERCTR
jgi:hypothetical protein